MITEYGEARTNSLLLKGQEEKTNQGNFYSLHEVKQPARP